jgi:hypothetical protein
MLTWTCPRLQTLKAISPKTALAQIKDQPDLSVSTNRRRFSLRFAATSLPDIFQTAANVSSAATISCGLAIFEPILAKGPSDSVKTLDLGIAATRSRPFML